ncbi:MAG: hypothetical protein H8E40_07020 [Chloroflexi bacterium]|nr:hypothetical protein [Chloroflexota bacterium]MBL7061643.1 hypothetical protein [Dehalococcoidia bacterium]
MGAGVVIRQVGVWEGILVGLIDISQRVGGCTYCQGSRRC